MDGASVGSFRYQSNVLRYIIVPLIIKKIWFGQFVFISVDSEAEVNHSTQEVDRSSH